MFNLVGRTLKFYVVKMTSIHRLFPSSSSTSPAASNNLFAVSYLIDSCGFPPEKAISVSSYLNFKTPDRADSVIAFVKDRGFTETQICNLVRKYPTALTYHPQKNLLPKFDFLSSIGLSDSDIYKLFNVRPNLLGRSLKKHIEPNYNALRDLLQSNNGTLIAIRRCVWVLDWNFQANLFPNMRLLCDVGVPRSKMMYVLTYQPRDFLVPTEHFKKVMEEAVEMGFDHLKISFVLAVHAIRSMSKSTWEKKTETYKKWGWSKAEILLAFRTNPWCMMVSKEKIDRVMDFLVNKMGLETSFVTKDFALISLSVEKRIIPRVLVFNYCLENGLMKDKKTLWFRLVVEVFGEFIHQEIGKIRDSSTRCFEFVSGKTTSCVLNRKTLSNHIFDLQFLVDSIHYLL